MTPPSSSSRPTRCSPRAPRSWSWTRSTRPRRPRSCRRRRAQGAAVIAYDRPIPAKQADYYVSFDNEKIGSLIAQDLVDHLKETGATGGLLQINGSPTDAAAGLIKKGVHSVTDSSEFELLAEFDTPEWKPENAQNWTAGEITQYQGKIAGVVAANDGTGGGAIAAFKAAGVSPGPGR